MNGQVTELVRLVRGEWAERWRRIGFELLVSDGCEAGVWNGVKFGLE